MNNSEKLFSRLPVLWLCAMVCCLLWGSAFPAIKTGYQLFNINSNDTASIIVFAGMRFILAGLLTIIIFSLINKKPLLPSKKSIPVIGMLSLFHTVLQYIFFYLGLARTSGDKASVINGTSVFFALIISGLIFKMEKLTWTKLFGCLIGFAGVMLVSLDVLNSEQSSSVLGEMFMLMSAVSYAFASVLMKKYSKNRNPAMLSGYQFFSGGIVMTVFGLLMGGKISNFNFKSVALLIYLAMVSAVAYSLWSILLKYNPVSRVAVCGFMTPVFGYILSLVFGSKNTDFAPFGIIALIFVVLGMIIVNTNKTKKKNGNTVTY